MGSGIGFVLVFVVVAIALMAASYFLARRAKESLDESPTAVAGVRGVVQIPAASAQQLLQLSKEPILIKQSEEGVRVQIEHRPMLPLMAFVGKDVSGALAAAAAAVTERYGATWVVLASAAEDGRLTLQRLA